MFPQLLLVMRRQSQAPAVIIRPDPKRATLVRKGPDPKAATWARY